MTKLEHENPQGVKEPSQPPVGAPEEPQLEVGHFSTDANRSTPEGMNTEEAALPYTEGTQPPRTSNRDLTQMAAIVGGQAVRKQTPKERREGDSIDPKQATHGQDDGTSAMQLGQKIMEGGTIDSTPNSGLPGVPENQSYQEPSQVPQTGISTIKNVPNVVGGQNAEAYKPEPKNKALKAPERRSGEAVSALLPNVKGGDDAARIAKQDIELAEGRSSPSPAADLQRVSEESVRKEDEADGPTADQKLPAKDSEQHVHNLLGDGLVAEKHERPKGLGSAQLLPQHRPGTKKSRKQKHGLQISKKRNKSGTRGSNSGSQNQDPEEESEESWSEWFSSNKTLIGATIVVGVSVGGYFCWRKYAS